MLSVAVLSAGAGSALLASPANAGWVDVPNGGLLVSFTSNLTPYTWTLVAAQSRGGWFETPASTLQPGDSPRYVVYPYQTRTPGICFGNDAFDYDAYLTYQVNVLGGPPEYANVVIWGTYTDNLCLGAHGVNDPLLPGFAVYFTSSPPPPGYDALNASGAAPGPQIANPQLTYQHNVPNLFDQSFQAVGNYTVDASTNLGAPFVNVLNTLCSGATNTTCSFTQQGPLTWGTGDASSPYIGTHCGAGTSNFGVSYTAAQTATLSVGGGLTLATQVTLFDVESNSIAVSVEASHQWSETKSETRMSSMDIPAGDIGYLWVIPTVGKVVGTLVVSNGSATFTANNFTQVRSGVSRNSLTPAFDVVTKVRPMTPAELQNHCGGSIGSTLGAASGGKKPPVTLVPGRGVAGVSLGQTQRQVERELGPATRQQFLVDPCQGLERGCDAVLGTGGRWTYPKRKLTVVFGHDTRVSGLIYRGAQRTGRGAGVGASEPVVRGSHPQVTCSLPARGRKNCTLIGTNAGRTVKTVFGFRRMSGGLYKCDRVLIYVLAGARKGVAS
jgi:hypothetical protein